MSLTSSTIKAVMASALLASLAACSSGSSGSGNGGGLGPMKPDGVVKAGSVGVFTSEKEMPIKDGIAPTEMNLPETADCAAKSEDEKWHPVLQAHVDDKMIEQSTNASTDSSYSETTETWIVSLTANQVVTDQRLTNIKVNPNPGFDIPPSLTVQSTCDLVKGDTQNCNYKFLDYSGPTGGGNDINCYMNETDWAATKGTVALGKFRMSNGQVVNAQKTEKTSKGKIVCHRGQDGKELDMGTGTEIVSEIVTDEVVSVRPVSCSGHLSVYRYSTIIKDDGSTIEAGKTEVLSANLR